MPLTLYVDRGAWRHHQMCVTEAEPGLVPVAKGNGYGFTVPVLARAAAGLGVDQLAVGTADEAAAVIEVFSGDVIVLEAYLDNLGLAGADHPQLPEDRVVRTAASVDAVRKLAGQRMIIDCRSSLRRQGIAPQELGPAIEALGGQSVDGFS
ncbi:MAG: alanine racemase, partial [Actinocrinis sp.]